MMHRHLDTHDAFCARCLASCHEHAETCPGCDTPFFGAGAFDRIRGPRPSRLFAELFAPRSDSPQSH